MKNFMCILGIIFIMQACGNDREDLLEALQNENIPPIDQVDQDTDGDGVADDVEKIDGTDINNNCSFVLSNQKLVTSTLWDNADCDADGVVNAIELVNKTNPLVADTDDDGINDGSEIAEGTDPLKADSDGDGVSDGVEKTDGSNPLKMDTDEDGVNDGTEKQDKTDPLKSDTDGDGVSDGIEKTDGTDPLKIDTDGDGVSDAIEKTDGTNPLNLDTDGDGLSDGVEKADETDPLKRDTDGDGVSDTIEKNDNTNPLDFCLFIPASQNETPSNAWNTSDCDRDSIANGQELVNGTNPLVFNEPVSVSSPIVGVWNLTDASIANGTGTTVFLGITYNLAYTAKSNNENVRVTFTENPNNVTSVGNYQMLLTFNFLGRNYEETLNSESPFNNGAWVLNNNQLTITANNVVNGVYDISFINQNTITVSVPVNRDVPAGGVIIAAKGTLVMTFSK